MMLSGGMVKAYTLDMFVNIMQVLETPDSSLPTLVIYLFLISVIFTWRCFLYLPYIF